VSQAVNRAFQKVREEIKGFELYTMGKLAEKPQDDRYE